MIGTKSVRWSRVVNHETGRGLIVPIDHGMTAGNMPGLTNSSEVQRWIRHPAITSIIAHKGMVERLAAIGCLRGKGVILQLNGMLDAAIEPNRKELVTSVDTALRLGADAVSLDMVFDGKNDSHNITLLGAVVDEANKYSLPVLVMVKSKRGVQDKEASLGSLRNLVRAIWELGADAIKMPKPEHLEDLPQILDGLHSDVNIFIAGGARCSDAEIVKLQTMALKAGAKGLCVGRNIFQNTNPDSLLTTLSHSLKSHAEHLTVVAAH